MSLTIAELGRMTPDQLRQLEADLATDEGQQQAYAVAQELLREWDGQPNVGPRVVGYGARNDHVRAVQLITRAAALRDGVEDARDTLTVDGIFGNDTRAAVGLGQVAAGEREDYIAGKYYALSHVHAMAGLQPPQGASYRDRRLAMRQALESQPDLLARAAPLPGAAAPEPVATPDPLANPGADPAAALQAASLLADGARADAYRQIGAAARADGQVAGALADEMSKRSDAADSIVHFLRANDGLDNSAIVDRLRGTLPWGLVRTAAANPRFNAEGLSSATLDMLAGEPVAAGTPGYATWQALRLRAVAAKAAEGTRLDRRDLDSVVASGDQATLGLLTRGPQADAVAALRARIDTLQPDPAAQLLRALHGDLSAPATAETPARRALAHAVLRDVFANDGVGDDARHRFFTHVAAEGSPLFVTMDANLYKTLYDKIWDTSTDWAAWYGGARSVGRLLDRLDSERRGQAVEAPAVVPNGA